MSFIQTVPYDRAEGPIKEIYDAAQADMGYIPRYVEIYSERPDVFSAWVGLNTAIRKHVRLRRYLLVTLAAARELGCTYCMLSYGDITLNSGEIDETQLIAIVEDYRNARLSAEEVAVMDFATKIIRRASSVTHADIEHLRTFGIADTEILDITLVAAARSFFSKVLDALSAEPDEKYQSLSPQLRAALAIGRPFA